MEDSKTGFFDLPREIRDIIYEDLVEHAPREQRIYSKTHVVPDAKHSPALLYSAPLLRMEISFRRPMHYGLISSQFYYEYEEFASRFITACFSATARKGSRDPKDCIRTLSRSKAIQPLRSFPIYVFLEGLAVSMTGEKNEPGLKRVIDAICNFLLAALPQIRGLENIEIRLRDNGSADIGMWYTVDMDFRSMFNVLENLKTLRVINDKDDVQYYGFRREEDGAVYAEPVPVARPIGKPLQ